MFFFTLGHFEAGSETTTNSYIGHHFYFALSSNKSEVVADFNIVANQVFYIVYDDEFPASKEVMRRTEKELLFNQEYLERTGTRKIN